MLDLYICLYNEYFDIIILMIYPDKKECGNKGCW